MKNTHLEHPEDNILNNGKEGAKTVLKFFQEKNSKLSVKYDGSPAIVWGRNPENDKLEEVLNYEYLIESLDDVLSLGRFSLLETLAHRLLEEVSIPNSVKAASVVITKLDVLNGDGTLGCSMTKIK